MRTKHFWQLLLIVLIATTNSWETAFMEGPGPKFDQATVRKIAGGYEFSEGPCWRQAGYLVFSDINRNTIYQWSPELGVSTFRHPSGNSNGIAEDRQGRLLVAQHANRRVVRWAVDGSEMVLAAEFQGKRFNSPNDLVIRSDGQIYFTDPPLGIRPQEQELNFAGVYRIAPDGTNLELLDKSLELPNGIAFSPNEKVLYVADTRRCQIVSYDVTADGAVAGRRIVVTFPGNGEFDGMKTDKSGNLWVAYSEGFIMVFNPEGKELGRLFIPEHPRNLVWGNSTQTVLFVTSGNSVYQVDL